MSNSNSLPERMAEARATAETASITRLLNDAAMDPSTKRFTKGRGARIERWAQLEAVAHSQVSGLQALAKAAVPRRAPKVRTETGHLSGGSNIQAVPLGTPGLVAHSERVEANS